MEKHKEKVLKWDEHFNTYRLNKRYLFNQFRYIVISTGQYFKTEIRKSPSVSVLIFVLLMLFHFLPKIDTFSWGQRLDT